MKTTVLFLALVLLIVASNPDSMPRLKAQILSPHGPILISGDSDFLPQNGVTRGNGSIGNPFTIEGWDIDAASTHGIHLRNTQKFFLVRNVTVHGGYPNAGIFLESTANGRIENTTLTDNQYGISLSLSRQNRISQNTIANNSVAVYLVASTNNTINDNQLTANTEYGVQLSSADMNTITGNNASNISNGSSILIGSSSGNIVQQNILSNNRWFGLDIVFSSNNILGNNTSTGSHVGIVLVESSSNLVTENNASNNDYGIGLEDPDTSNIYSTSNNNITGNTILNNNAGLYTVGGANNLLYNNRLENPLNAYDDGTGNSWYVAKRPGTNILGGPFQGGNYYSNYAGLDSDADGIGNSAYTVPGPTGSLDNLPLVASQPTVVHDIAAVTVTVQPASPSARQNTNITATVFNQGTVPETFTVRFFYNTTLIPGQVTVTALAPWTQTNVTIQWNTPNTPGANYTVRAEASVVNGEVDIRDNTSPSANVSLSANNPPVASFTILTSNPVILKPVTLDASASYDQDLDPVQYQWQFGDGSTGTGPIVSHTYSSPGSYMIILTVSDDHGGLDSTMTTLILPPALPSRPVISQITVSPAGALLEWTPPSTSSGLPTTGYKVYRGTSPSSLALLETLGNITAYMDPGPLVPGETYYYAVTAVNEAGEGEYSETRDVLVSSTGPGNPSPLDNPAILAGTGVTVGLVTVGTAYLLSRRRKTATSQKPARQSEG